MCHDDYCLRREIIKKMILITSNSSIIRYSKAMNKHISRVIMSLKKHDQDNSLDKLRIDVAIGDDVEVPLFLMHDDEYYGYSSGFLRNIFVKDIPMKINIDSCELDSSFTENNHVYSYCSATGFQPLLTEKCYSVSFSDLLAITIFVKE